MLNIITESASAIVALLFGILAFGRMNLFQRLLFIQLTTWFLLYTLSYFVTTYQKQNGLSLNNHWVFNLNIFMESSLLSFAAYAYFKNTIKKKVIVSAYTAFLLTFCLLLSLQGLFQYNTISYTLESLIIIVFYSLILFECYNESTSKLRSPEIWISIGFLIYFTCNLPYFSLFNFLIQNKPELSSLLFGVITEILSNLRYLFLAIGFYLIWRKRVSNTQLSE